MQRWLYAACSLVLMGCQSTPVEVLTLSPLTAESGGELAGSQASVEFVKADLSWQIFPAKKALAAEAELSFVSLGRLQEMQLDLDPRFHIEKIQFNGHNLASNKWSNPQGKLNIQLPAVTPNGVPFKLTIVYSGKPHTAKHAPWDGGFVWSQTSEGLPWIATAVQGEGCDLFWPCIDHPMGEPEDVTMNIKVPDTLVAVANGRLTNVTQEPGWLTYHWQTKHPNTYAIALNIGPYEKLEAPFHSRYGNEYPMQFWYLRGEETQARELFKEFPQQLSFFEDMIGPYPFSSEKMAAVHTPHKGMEHQTINAYGNDFAKSKYGYDDLLQHELAHEWFGNQLTNKDWDDFWLHESFATYMQPLYAEYLWGDMAYKAQLYEMRLGLRNRVPMVSGSSKFEEEVYREETGPGMDIYIKGALILHTLREYMGDKRFFSAVRELVYGSDTPHPSMLKPRYASTQDFVKIVSDTMKRDMSWFFNVYLYQADLPELKMISQGNQVQLRWDTSTPFPMPLEVTIDGQLTKLTMDNGSGVLTLKTGQKLKVDPGQKVLRHRQYIDDYKVWQQQQKAAKQE